MTSLAPVSIDSGHISLVVNWTFQPCIGNCKNWYRLLQLLHTLFILTLHARLNWYCGIEHWSFLLQRANYTLILPSFLLSQSALTLERF